MTLNGIIALILRYLAAFDSNTATSMIMLVDCGAMGGDSSPPPGSWLCIM